MSPITNETISTKQLIMLLVVSRVNFTLGYFPALANPDLKQDAWIACLTGAAAGIPICYLLSMVWRRFPGKTFAEVVETVLGRFLGKTVLGWYAIVLLMLFALDLRLAGEFFIYSLLQRTPQVVLTTSVAVLAAWAARSGLEVIARASQVIFPVLVGSLVLVFVLLIKDIRWSAFQPVLLQSGPVAIAKETAMIASRNIELIPLLLIVPSISDQNQVMKGLVHTFLWAGIIWTMMAVTITGVLGQFQELLYFPFYAASRQILVADFLERIDFLIVGIWSFGVYLRSGLTLWSCTQFVARWFGIKDYRPLVLALGGIGVTLSIAMAQSLSEVRSYLRGETFAPFMFTFILVIPMLVLLFAVLRGKRGVRAQ